MLSLYVHGMEKVAHLARIVLCRYGPFLCQIFEKVVMTVNSKTLLYILKRLVLALITVWVIITITFFVTRLVPGGPFQGEKAITPEAKAALDKFKMEAASEVGVNLKNGYNGDLTAKQAGSVGGQMVKKMIETAERNMK